MGPEAFKKALAERGLSRQVDAAAALGVSQSTICRWLNGWTIPKPAELLLDRLPKKPGRKARLS